MSRIDVSAQIDIAAEPTDVAGVMFDPHREPEWMTAIERVDVLDRGIRPGAQVRRTATLLGRTTTWTTEVVAFHFPHVLELRISDGPFSGQLTYHVGRAGGGSVARISGVGDAGAFGPLTDAAASGPVRQALAASLARLKSLVEQAASAR